ncbi:hypothetical protein H4R99_001323 [Coemansia sp. RSA 1722]|nr:hypothetical protein LPJ57_000928 [Coemansia sp. RSA 486]KAJ2237106.1 hypothetical protein IWW45_001224 [Coemansia sp. RSA 485]KAJ2597766.1 hypothetical protein GGF39_002912 [Coemansia sp. RSA 1721]KAJ2605154.1 hypothetical protein H4R99_001323 [Coemansia sp. RSA 1722]KAJ2638637.1 hypothetical protein GGF40_001481 [Coemansia sp. RSA 1286]
MDFPFTQVSQKEIAEMHQKLVDEWNKKLKGRVYVKDTEKPKDQVYVDDVEKPKDQVNVDDAGKPAADDGTTFTKKMLPPDARVLEGPMAMMTMDYRVGRLNVHLDENGKFVNATAG